MLPNFIIIGAMKCGTTSLAYYLSQHPEIFVSSPDKIDFFSKDHEYSKGLAYYESFFENGGYAKAIGEGSDDYTKEFDQKSQKAVARIKEHLPGCKFIYVVKHPLKQIESSWLHRFTTGNEKKSFNEAISGSRFTYPETANYKKQLQRYYDAFSPEQIKVFFTEDLAAHPREVVRSSLEFLGVSQDTKELDLNPQNISSRKLLDKNFTRKMRSLPFIDYLAKNFPPAFKQRLEKIFTYQIKERPVWEKETLDYVLENIWTDNQDFLEAHGKSRNFWDLSEYNRSVDC